MPLRPWLPPIVLAPLCFSWSGSRAHLACVWLASLIYTVVCKETSTQPVRQLMKNLILLFLSGAWVISVAFLQLHGHYSLPPVCINKRTLGIDPQPAVAAPVAEEWKEASEMISFRPWMMSSLPGLMQAGKCSANTYAKPEWPGRDPPFEQSKASVPPRWHWLKTPRKAWIYRYTWFSGILSSPTTYPSKRRLRRWSPPPRSEFWILMQ